MRWMAAAVLGRSRRRQLAAQAIHVRLDLREALCGDEVAVRAHLQLGERLAVRTVSFLHECPAHGTMLPVRSPD